MELNKQEVQALIGSLELDIDSDKLDAYHRNVYQSILTKLKNYEESL